MDEFVELLNQIRNLKQATLQNKYCAFIDILGLRKKLEDLPTALSVYSDAMEALITPATQNNWFLKFLEQIDSPRSAFHPIDILVISDAVILTSDNLYSLLHYTAISMILSLGWGIPLRGWIAQGPHLQLTAGVHHLVLSPVLRDSFEGESEKAIYPRVVIDPLIMSDVQPDYFYSRFFIQDEDGFWFLNPYGAEYADDQVIRAVDFVRNALEEHKHNEHLLIKYCWLADFFNASLFGGVEHYYLVDSFRAEIQRRLAEIDYELKILPIPVWNYDISKERRFVMPFPPTFNYDSLSGIIWPTKPKDFYKSSFSNNWEFCSTFAKELSEGMHKEGK